ncbi:hypothetical protein LUZ63_002358 [Rhynchospora breviuscula]|uniref:Uncharacterized protein n=1 Tax=Rhynchospora breviuscula TaxID=2022672 RepID=A0A9Q0CYM4_9POAL|nr:hypothetical protein LUZ63_002358 [Rhynchospora breviuscula]
MLSFNSRGGSSSTKSTKVAPFSGISSKKIPDAHQVQLHRLEEELKKEREEKTRVLDELTELKKKSISQFNEYDARRMDMLEKQVEKAKQSERKMHESLVILTRQLEQTKTSLEQARVEISSLKQNRSKDNGKINSDEEVKVLKGELKSAVEAEEKANKAMHEFALLLKEVKDNLAITKSDLERAKIEVEENTATWRQKEESFLDCVKESTEANNKLKQENTKLFESQKVIREENARLRENLKRSLEEINTIKEELESVKGENSELKELLDKKEDALQNIKLDYESLKVSEAAAQRSLKELNHMLLIETTPKATSPYFSPSQGFVSPIYAKENANKSPKEASIASGSNLSEMKAASVAITEDMDQMERDYLISVDGSERKKKKKQFFGKFKSFFKGKGFKPVPPLPPRSNLPASYSV